MPPKKSPEKTEPELTGDILLKILNALEENNKELTRINDAIYALTLTMNAGRYVEDGSLNRDIIAFAEKDLDKVLIFLDE